MPADLLPNSPLEAAQKRLERAVEALAARVQAIKAAPPAPARLASSAEAKRLEAELESAHARERQLEQVAAEASAALGRAAAEVRAALAAEA